MGGQVSIGAGSDNFWRVFGRIDTGELSTGTAIFLSASDTTADKWRGFGKAPAGRKNGEVGLRQSFGDLTIKLVYAQNKQKQHNFKALTYTQASSLDAFRYYDYGNNPLTSDYYDYNRQDFRNQAVIAEFRYDFTPQTSLTVKPYYSKENGYYLFAGGNATMVQKWLIDHETYGVTSELQTVLADTNLKLGYAFVSTEPPGPPTTRKQYMVTASGLTFQTWSLLANVTKRHVFNNIYATAQHRFGPLVVQAGARYARESLPGIDVYNAGAGAAWDVSVADAIALATKNASRSVTGRSFDFVLPQGGLSYEFSPAVEIHASLGRNIGAPAFDAFLQAPAGGLTTLQGYWDLIRPELSTDLDIGAHLRLGDFYIDPTLYGSNSKNKAVAVFNANSNTVWSQNVGKIRARGAQLAAGWTPSEAVRVFGSYSYSRSYFAEDVRTAGGATLAVTKKQLPDVPESMANLGVAFSAHDVTFAPMLEYVGPRWSTITYTERLPGYLTVDATLSYHLKTAFGGLDASLAVMNAFDRKYIGQISTSEVNTTANGGIYYPGYYPGAPRTFVGKLSLTF